MNSPSQIAICRAARRKSAVLSTINAWPLLGITIVLLIIYMTAMPTHGHGMALDFPIVKHSVSQPAALREDVMRLTVTRDGKFYFRNTAVALADLVPLITAATGRGAEGTIYLAADQRAKNSYVEAAIDQIQKAGITKVTILTENFYPASQAIDARF